MFVLIVTKCNVNFGAGVPVSPTSLVLIVAKCNVNRRKYEYKK